MHITLNGARRTIRTVFQMLVGLAAMAPLIYSSATQHDPKEATGWAAVALAIAAGVTRVMAVPAVEDFLQRTPGLSWLAAKRPEVGVPVSDDAGGDDLIVPLPDDADLPSDHQGA
jgi:hypothetical protein